MIGSKTRLMYEQITKSSMTPSEMAVLLQDYTGFRSTKEKLERFSGGRDLRPLLTEGLLANDPTRKRDSVDRNVRNWLRGDKDVEINRATVFELAFILELDLAGTNALLAALTDEGLHWREPKEIVLIYARMMDMHYPEALALLSRIGDLPACNDSKAVTRENMTAAVHNAVMQLKSEDELAAYLHSSADVLGSMHNTAYVLFTRFFKLLEAPALPWDEELLSSKRMSAREILQVYLFRELVPVTKRKSPQRENAPALTAQQKEILGRIKAGWPDESTLSKMLNRETDVSRKVLILLFLATDGAGMQFGKPQDYARKAVNRAVLFKDSYTRLNRMLSGCGFAVMDARSPFDCLVLYCISVDAIEETDAKMEQTLTALFSGN